jgi:hypothetical protein
MGYSSLLRPTRLGLVVLDEVTAVLVYRSVGW